MMIVMEQHWLSSTNSNISFETMPTFAFLLRPLSLYKHLEFEKLLDLNRKYVIITNIALVLSGGNIFPGSCPEDLDLEARRHFGGNCLCSAFLTLA